jgi:hypothetical protein
MCGVAVACSAGCGDGGGAERAALNARIDALEQQVRRLSTARAAQEAPAGAVPKHPFKVACPQPWVLHTPLGATLWSCRSPSATPEGLYPQCSVTVQPQAAIETRGYFEFAMNAAPPLRAAENLQDRPVTLRGTQAFEATFEASAAPVPLKLLSVLLPHRENTYAITCSAPRASHDALVPAFRRIIDSFGFD